jgi:hypothetical protein
MLPDAFARAPSALAADASGRIDGNGKSSDPSCPVVYIAGVFSPGVIMSSSSDDAAVRRIE